jgi:hypothetical protein
MLEQALAELFDQQASEPLPAAGASIALAARVGRGQRRRRRILAVGTPVLAVAAVLAIAVAAALSPTATPPPPAQHRKPHSLPVAPRQFNSLVPYVSFGWLPPGAEQTSSTDGRTFTYLAVVGPRSDSWRLAVYARGVCTIRVRLECRDLTSRQAPPVGRGGHEIDGFPAYWYGPSLLIFEYARGGWASLSKLGQNYHPGQTRATALHIARTLRFGGPATPVRFPAQLTHLPSGWAVRDVISSYSRTGPLAFEFGIARGSRLNEPWTSTNDIPEFTIQRASLDPAGCYFTPGESEQIALAGHQVTITRKPAGVEPAEQDLCAANVNGLAVEILTAGNHPPIDVTALFARLRLLGPDPARWTTKPIR